MLQSLEQAATAASEKEIQISLKGGQANLLVRGKIVAERLDKSFALNLVAAWQALPLLLSLTKEHAEVTRERDLYKEKLEELHDVLAMVRDWSSVASDFVEKVKE